MHFLIVTDTYFPARTSVAVLLYDLTQTFIEHGVKISVVVPSASQSEHLLYKFEKNCQIISVKALKTKDVSYLRRTLNELINPWLIWHILKRSPQITQLTINGVIWYSPSIFMGQLIKRLKNLYNCRSYLILRDIFPDWALHVGILKKGPVYFFLKAIESSQYRQADKIGIQSPNSLTYFQEHHPKNKDKLEVLWNWTKTPDAILIKESTIVISQSPIAGRVIFVYLGNIGIAQGIQNLCRLIEKLKDNPKIGFLIVGRGSELIAIKKFIILKQLHNTMIHNEIDPFEIPSLLGQCDAGLVFLDRRHQSHNIPGKFISYLQAGLAVLAMVNPGNDLLRLIPEYGVGEAYEGDDINILVQKVLLITYLVKKKQDLQIRCKVLVKTLFESNYASQQILMALDSKNL